MVRLSTATRVARVDTEGTARAGLAPANGAPCAAATSAPMIGPASRRASFSALAVSVGAIRARARDVRKATVAMTAANETTTGECRRMRGIQRRRTRVVGLSTPSAKRRADQRAACIVGESAMVCDMNTPCETGVW